MSFLNPLILIAALGIALPILAHLLNRQQVKRTDWAAMQFLNRNLRVRSRQIRLRDILLLLLRCLALLLVIMAFSRPFWSGTSGNWFNGEARAGVVIAIDSSFSMGHTEGKTTRFDRALEQAGIIAESIQSGDPVSLILMSGQDELIVRNMAFDPVRFSEFLKGAKPSSAKLDLDRVAKRIDELVEDMDAPQKEVYFITDAQSCDWRRASLNLQSAFSGLQEKGKVFLVPVTGTGENMAVTELSLVSGVLRKGTTARYQATIHNYGSQPTSNLEVTCLVNGLQIDSKIIPIIEAGTSETVSLFVPFHNAGPTRITAKITDDFLPADNFRNIVSVIRERVSVLCVDGSNGDAGNLLISSLLARNDETEREDYSVRSIPWISLPSEQLDNIDVIILADVPEITEEQVDGLSHFVSMGKGLVWFGGDNVKTALWNERMSRRPNTLLPATLGKRVEIGNTASTVGSPLNHEMPLHGVCLPLRSLPDDLLSETLFLNRLDVKPSPSSSIILSLAGSGAPILLEHSLGRGHVFMFTTSAETSWNNMAQTPVFPMLMQQIVTYLTGREFEKPRIVGDSISLSYVEQPDVGDAVFETPSKELITVPVSEYRDQFEARLENSKESGFYEARVSVQSAGMPIAVNVDISESEVLSLNPSELSTNLKGSGVTIVNPGLELTDAIESNRNQRSFWRYFMIAGFILLITESIFADWLRKRKRIKSGSPQRPNQTLGRKQNA